MSESVNLYNDGTLPYGTRILSINSNNYVAENFSFDAPTREIRRYNQIGEPSGSVGISDFITGTCTIQLATTSTPIPQRHQTFITPDPQGDNKTYIIRSVGPAEGQADEKKVSITFTQKYN